MDNVVVAARLVLLDALEALGSQRDAVILVGAQAVYLRTGASPLAVAEYTRDADLALDPRRITPSPQLHEALAAAGFRRGDQPGIWLSTRRTSANDPVPVDFLVPEAVADRPGRRSANVPGQATNTARQVRGLEGALVDNDVVRVGSLDDDPRAFEIRVAGPAALLVAKVHKISERADTKRSRDKDALDIYRLLRAIGLEEYEPRLRALLQVDMSVERTAEAIEELERLFSGTRSIGTEMVVRSVAGLEDEDDVRRSVVALTLDLVAVARKLG